MSGYKRLTGATQNFIHSFFSDMNYVDDEFVSFEIKKSFLNSKLEKAEIDLINFENSSEIFKTERIIKGFGYYKGMLEDQVVKHKCDIGKIKGLKIIISTNSKEGIQYEGRMLDDRGKETKLKVILS